MEELIVAGVIVAAALVASTLAAVAGFGGAAIMLPILVWAVGLNEAIPLLTVAQLMGNLSRVWFNRGELSIPVVKWFAFGAVPTAIIGGIVFATAPAETLIRVLGVFLLITVAYRHTPFGKGTRIGLRGFLPLGAASGIISATMGVVGPFMAPFFLAFGLVKGAYIGTEALATVVMHVFKLGVYGSYSLLSPQLLLIGVAIGTVMFFGSYLGKRILIRMPDKSFPYVIEAVLIVAGLRFVIWG